MNRACLVSAMLAVVGVAHAGPEGGLAPAPPPDGAGVRPAAVPVDNRRTIGILDIRVEGIPEAVKDRFQHDLEGQLDTKQYWLANREHVKKRLMRSTKWTEGCFVGACLNELRAATGAELVLLAALTGSGTSFGYVVTLIRTDTGRVLRQNSDRCDVCTVNEVVDKATLATIELLNNIPEKLPDEAAEQRAAIEAAVDRARRETEAREQHTTRLGIAITAIGVAVAAVGVVLYVRDSSSDIAAPLAAGGGALALGGIAVLTF
ncbi:MAG TPA: hypothetical protein VFT22_35655 [Kofleriaceae bacterium]|nr:hypothetical protein [Kofleriaceae bacterium]